MEVREATTQDWKEVRDLYLDILLKDPNAFADQYSEVLEKTDEDWIKILENPNGKTFIAEENGKFIGMGRINFYDELPGIPVLHKLGVLPEYREKGIAKHLVSVREEWAKLKGASKVRLYVLADRIKTIEFSKKNGYMIIETQKANTQRQDGTWMDTVIMEKSL